MRAGTVRAEPTVRARIGRLAGALLVESKGEYYLVGNTKEPCDFAAAGLEAPKKIDALAQPSIRLRVHREIVFDEPWLTLNLELELEPEVFSAAIAERFVIERNGSVSERLWNLVTQQGRPESELEACEVDATWLATIPSPIWQIVRDTVLRCS